MNIKKEVDLACDDDFFTLFECMFCGKNFKIANSFCIEEEFIEVYCPYCGMVGESDDFMAEEIRSELKDEVYNMAIEHINNTLIKGLKNSFKNNSFIKFEANSLKTKTVRKASEVTDMQKIKSKCCNVEIKIDNAKKQHYCIRCGGYND